LNNFEIIVK